MKHIAKALASHGRGPDTTLVHMSVPEVEALDKMARSCGLGSLTKNPKTGLPEAGLLSTILPVAAAFIPGVGPAASMALSAGAGALGSAIEGGSPEQMTGAAMLGGLGNYGLGKMGYGDSAVSDASKAGFESGLPMQVPGVAPNPGMTLGSSMPQAPQALPYDQQIDMTPLPQFQLANPASGAEQFQALLAQPAPTQPQAQVPQPQPQAQVPQQRGFWDKVGDFALKNPQYSVPLALQGIRAIRGKNGGPQQPQRGPYQTATASTSQAGFNNYRAQRGFAEGGVPSLLRGPGDGMSDHIPAAIYGRGGPEEPIRVADGEFIVSADVVSGLGNGSTEAGARELEQMMARVREARTGKTKQAPAIKSGKYLPA